VVDLRCVDVVFVPRWWLVSCAGYLIFLPLFHDGLITSLMVKILSPITGLAEKRFRMINSANVDLDTSGIQRLEKNCKYLALSLFDPRNSTFSALVLTAILTTVLWFLAGLLMGGGLWSCLYVVGAVEIWDMNTKFNL